MLAVSDPIQQMLLERGILGLLVLVLGWFAWLTIKKLRSDLEESLQRERDFQLQTYTRTIPIVERFTAVQEARSAMDAKVLEVLTDVRRELERMQRREG